MNENNSYRSAYYDLCDYLNGWTESKYAENHAVYDELTEEEKENYCLMSPEVRDRNVSVIGLAVPLGLYFLCIYTLCVVLGAASHFVRGKKS